MADTLLGLADAYESLSFEAFTASLDDIIAEVDRWAWGWQLV